MLIVFIYFFILHNYVVENDVVVLFTKFAYFENKLKKIKIKDWTSAMSDSFIVM